jgi:hypothetical protein
MSPNCINPPVEVGHFYETRRTLLSVTGLITPVIFGAEYKVRRSCDSCGFHNDEDLEFTVSSFCPEDGGDRLLRNVDRHLQDYTASKPRRPQSKLEAPHYTMFSNLPLLCFWCSIVLSTMSANTLQNSLSYFIKIL